MREESLAKYAYNFIKEICQRFGPRYSCSKEEKEANLWIKEEFSKYCDEVHIEEFKAHPNLYPQGIFKVVGVLAGISWIFFPMGFPFSIIPALCIFLGFFILITELMMLKRWIKIFFKSGISSNVWGRIKPTGEIKYRVIFEGHTDSAKMMRTVNENANPKIIFLFLGLIYLIYTLVLSIIKSIAIIVEGKNIAIYQDNIIFWTIYDWIYFIPWIILFPSFLYLLYGLTGNVVVEGANDNLSGSAVSAAIGKYFYENRPKNIEIIIGSMGSEEIGDRGAKYFVDQHGDLLKKSYAFIIDSAGVGDKIYIVEKDNMHLTKYSPEVVERIEKAYKMYKEKNPDAIPCERGGIPLGSSDACMYAKAGYKASFIICIGEKLKKPPHWHSITDTWDQIDEKVLKDVIGICLNFVELVDKEFENK
ncbi:MAG: M28 family metallopeptidase [Promethearchaeota archaeon]